MGVIIAASRKIARIAYRLFRMRNPGVTILNMVNTKIRTGISKTRPTPKVTLTNKLKYSVIYTIATT